MKNYLVNILAAIFGWDLKSQSKKAIAKINAGNDRIEEARQVLARTQATALADGQAALASLKAAAATAATTEQEAEKARQQQVTDFDAETAAEVAALQEKLRLLKLKRDSKKGVLTAELADERQEAAEQAAAAEAAEQEINALLEALQLDVDAQNGLNEASK